MSEFTQKARALIQQMRDETFLEITLLMDEGQTLDGWQSPETSPFVAKRAAAEILKANPLLRPDYVANSLVPASKMMLLLGKIAELNIKLEVYDNALANLDAVAAEAAGTALANDQNN